MANPRAGLSPASSLPIERLQPRAWRRRAQRVVLTHRRVARYVEAMAETLVETWKCPAAQLPSISIVRTGLGYRARARARASVNPNPDLPSIGIVREVDVAYPARLAHCGLRVVIGTA